MEKQTKITQMAKFPVPKATKKSGKADAVAKGGEQVVKLTDDDLRNRLLDAYSLTTVGLLEKIEAEAEFGGVWSAVKSKLKREKGTVQEWIARHKLPFSHQYANGCARLAQTYDTSFKKAHDWYRQYGFDSGYRTRKNSGWEYGLEVIAQHSKSQRGEDPTSQTDAAKSKKETPREKIGRLTIELANREQEVAALTLEVDRISDLYRQTTEGANYTDSTLRIV